MAHYLIPQSETVLVCACGREFSAHDLMARTTVYLDPTARRRFVRLNLARATRHVAASRP